MDKVYVSSDDEESDISFNTKLLPQTHSQKGQYYFPARYIFVILAFLGNIMIYSLRVNLSVAIVSMVKYKHTSQINVTESECIQLFNHTQEPIVQTDGEFDWDPNTQSLILGSFFWGYIVAQIPGGKLALKYGSKRLLGFSVFLTSFFTILSPIAARLNYFMFILCRGLEGLAEGVFYPSLHSMIGKWIPKFELSFLGTLIYIGGLIGNVVALPLTGFLIDSGLFGGWPSAFYIIGLAGIVWFCLWMFYIHETPQEHPRISKDELQLILSGQDSDKINKNQDIPWKSILTSLPVWALVIAHFGHIWGFYTLLFQLPTYFRTVLGLEIKKNSLSSSVPYLLQAMVACVVGYLVDALIKKNVFTLQTARKFCNTVGFLGPALCLFGVTLVKCNYFLILSLISLAMAINGFAYSGYNVTHLDMSQDFAGTLMGLTNCIANTAGILAPGLVGIMTQNGATIENWSYVFYTSVFIYLVSSLIFLVFGSNKLQPWGVAKNNRSKNKYPVSAINYNPEAKNYLSGVSSDNKNC